LLAKDYAEVQRWLGELTRRDSWRIIENSPFRFNVNLGEGGEAMLLVLDANGVIIGGNRAPPSIAPLDEEPELVALALAGERDPEKLFRRNPQAMVAVAAIFENDGRVAGVLVARVTNLEADERTFWLAAVAGSFLPALCVMLPIAALIGLFFGFITARSLTKRLGRVATASEAWSAGNFAVSIQDKPGDELGQLGQRLNAMAQQLQTLVSTQQELAVAEERNRLALDLHDSVKQQAFAASAQLGAARALLPTNLPAAEARLAEAENLMDGLRQELAHLILELRPPQLAQKGLAAALREYVAEWSRQNGLPAEISITGERTLPNETEQSLFRIAQEALANIACHSRATHANITLAFEPQQTRLEIADNGRGFDTQNIQAGVDTRSMRERAQAIGGAFALTSTPNTGTTITVTILTI
jgi:signal transduction histidine kinase